MQFSKVTPYCNTISIVKPRPGLNPTSNKFSEFRSNFWFFGKFEAGTLDPNWMTENENRMTEILYCNYIFRSCSIVNVYLCKFVGHVLMLTFVVVNIFWSFSTWHLVIFVRSCELASKIFRYFRKKFGSEIFCW